MWCDVMKGVVPARRIRLEFYQVLEFQRYDKTTGTLGRTFGSSECFLLISIFASLTDRVRVSFSYVLFDQQIGFDDAFANWWQLAGH